MKPSEFEERLRGHLAAKANLIDVPEHRFVQTKVIPFQPRRHRMSTLMAAAAGVAIVAMLGFGVFQASGRTANEASIIPGVTSPCAIHLIPGEPGFWVTIDINGAEEGPFTSDADNLALEFTDPGPATIRVYQSDTPDDLTEDGTLIEEAVISDPACGDRVTVEAGGEVVLLGR